MARALQLQEQRFLAEYLIDGDAARSAIAAGYPDPKWGPRLIRKPSVRQALEVELEKRRQRPTVFVSYAASDGAAALPIIGAIRQAGLNISNDELQGGARFDHQIHEIKRADCIVVLWSEAAASSLWVQQEIRQATIQAWSADRLVLAALDDTRLPIGLRDLSVISIQGASDFDTQQLIDRIRATLADRDSLQRLGPPRPPRAGRAIPSTLVVGLAIAGLGILTAWGLEAFTPSPLLISLTVLVLGAVIGQTARWVWTARLKRRLQQRVGIPTESNGAQQILIFVSYSHRDGLTVGQLVQQIEQVGYAVWIDRAAAGPQRYAGQIVRAIRASRLVALMCSQNAFASDHVIREVYVAGDYKKPFVLFELDSTEFPDDIVYFVSGFPRIPVATMDSQRLRSEIARLVAA